MIKSVYLEDFQSHAKTKVELAPAGGLTVLCGPTDSGKTAIVRALRLLFYNVPQGADYIRVGRSMAVVALEMSDGTKVARERSKSVNRYRITKPGESASVFEGFGGAVPLEVQEATGVRTVTVGDLELALNLSEQLDGPFLGNKAISGPARAKILGKLAGTEEVDEAQRQLGTDLFRAGQDEKRLLTEIEALDARIREYDYLPNLAEKIAALEALLQAIRESQARLSMLETASQKLTSIQVQRAQALAILAKWKGLREAELCVITAEEDASRANALASHKATLARIAADRQSWVGILNRWANLPAAETLMLEAEAAHSRATVLRSASETLSATRVGKAKVADVLCRWAHLEEAEGLVAECFVKSTRADNLERYSLKLADLDAQISEAIELRDRWFDLKEASAISSTVNERLERMSLLANLQTSLTRIREAKVVVENDLDTFSKMLRDAQRQYSDTLVSMGRCPTCGSKVDPSLVKEVA